METLYDRTPLTREINQGIARMFRIDRISARVMDRISTRYSEIQYERFMALQDARAQLSEKLGDLMAERETWMNGQIA
jgi:hypothetical protein